MLGIGGRLPTTAAVMFQLGEVGREGAIQMAWIDLISIRTLTWSMSLCHTKIIRAVYPNFKK